MRFSAFVKVDCGYGRAGVPVTQEGAAFCVAVAECPYVNFQGV
jgi:D-serine deaminase-like pyridoxal phosphate-dependent protein